LRSSANYPTASSKQSDEESTCLCAILQTFRNTSVPRTCFSCRRAFSCSESCRGGAMGLAFGSSTFGLPRIRLPVVSDSLSARFARWASSTWHHNSTPRSTSPRGVAREEPTQASTLPYRTNTRIGRMGVDGNDRIDLGLKCRTRGQVMGG